MIFRPTIFALSAAALAVLVWTSMPARADDQVSPSSSEDAKDSKGPGSDTVAVLVSDTNFGPDSSDADTAARYYCSNRGKLSVFVSKEHPSEFRTQMLQSWAVFTYRCVSADAKK